MRGKHRRRLSLEERRARAERTIAERGYELLYVEWCEDGETPGLLGMFGGITDRKRRKVKIRTRDRSEREVVETLEHEAHHVVDPLWDCGSRGPWDRSPRPGEPGYEDWKADRDVLVLALERP